MDNAVIISGARTPIGRYGGAFKSLKASDLGSIAIKSAIERSGITASDVEEVVLGNALQTDEAGYAARMASLKSGISYEVPTIAINRQCSSGLEAINIAAQMIISGAIDIAVAGGIEHMSGAPYLMRNVRWDGLRMGDGKLQDSLIEGLNCPANQYHMGVTAENVAQEFEVSRADQDELAVLSHQRAVKAIENGRFDKYLVSVEVPQRRGDPVLVSTDEQPRADASFESLSTLKPVFRENGTVTAGNSSGINDGAAAVVIMSESKAQELGLKPIMKWVNRSVAGVEPSLMGTGPVPAVQKLIKKTGINIGDIDLIELNEAFASQALFCMRELDLDIDVTNVNGSGISLGHPVGATGAIMTVKLMEEMEYRDINIGLATMCVGGGQGCATIFERLN